MNDNVIRAVYDEDTITVYQAYNKAIANAAVQHQTFVSPFKKDRMTWIKPSFLWMMYRCGWAEKENQEHVLAVKIKRTGFEWALRNACMAQYDHHMYATQQDWKEHMKVSPVRVQWDPEKDIYLKELPYRSIQIGLTGIAVDHYISDWITEIEDITAYSKELHQLIKTWPEKDIAAQLPVERPYTLPADIANAINATIL